MLWLALGVCTAVILYCGTRLAKYGDVIAEKTGLGRTFTGFVLFAAVTSMPELVNGVSAVAYVGTPDIAVGDVLGSCVFNLLIIAFMDAFYRPQPIFGMAKPGHVLSAGFGILLLSVVVAGLFLGGRIAPLGWLGFYSVVITGIYIVAMRVVYRYEKRMVAEYIKEAVEELYGGISKETAVRNFALNAVVVVVAAIFLPEIGVGIAEQTGLGQTFVGNIFIAASTSLPEIVVSAATVRMKAVDLAIGNILGSNIFNVMILAVDDLFFLRGPLFSHTDPDNIVPAVSAIAMTAIVVIGLLYRPTKKKSFFVEWDSMALMGVFVVNLLVLYFLRG